MIENLFNGVGLIPVDFLLATLFIIAGVSQAWQYTVLKDTSKFYRLGCSLASAGWLFWGTRMFVELFNGGDPKVAIPGIVAILLLTTGSIMKSLYSGYKDSK